MSDRYLSFVELSANEHWLNYAITAVQRGSQATVLAIHAGAIEPGTGEIAREIAGDSLNLYLFAGVKKSDNADLHITSGRFDEPHCVQLVQVSEIVLSVHGCRGAQELTFLGGRDRFAVKRISSSLRDASFACDLHSDPMLQGCAPANICNRGASGAGVQLELTRALRDRLGQDAKLLVAFATAVRQALV